MHPLDLFKYCPKCGSSHFEIRNEKAKKCADCGFTYYFNSSAATVAFILNARNELLVCRRGKEPAKGTLDLSGGFIDMAETGEEGVAREVREETGLQVVEATYLFSLPNTYLYSGFLVHTLDLFFLCRVADDSNCWQWMMWPIRFGCLWIRFVRKNLDGFGPSGCCSFLEEHKKK